MPFARVAGPCVPAPCALVPWNPAPVLCTGTGCHYCWETNTQRETIVSHSVNYYCYVGAPDLLSLWSFSPLLQHFSHKMSSKGVGCSRLDHQASRNLNGQTAFDRALWSGFRDATRPLTRCTGRLGPGSEDIEQVVNYHWPTRGKRQYGLCACITVALPCRYK